MSKFEGFCKRANFVEIGVSDVDLFLGLRNTGHKNYLGVSDDNQQLEKLTAKYPEIADLVTSSKRSKIVRQNNADVLLLNGRWMSYLWKYRSLRHAKYVAWPRSYSLLSFVALCGCVWQWIAKRYSWPQTFEIATPDGATKKLYVTEIDRCKSDERGSLHFIPHESGLAGLFGQFNEAGIRYVVLRWFEWLPDIEPDKNIDILIADESLPAALAILNSRPGILPCDIYSEHGLFRSDYKGTPYYPAHVAGQLLDGAEKHNDISVPNQWDHFHSLAYHAVYHKGQRSNLSQGGTVTLPENTRPSRDYAGILRAMAQRLGIDVEISLEGLHQYLQRNNWGPSPQMLARLSVASHRNKWLQLLAQRLQPHLHDKGLTVFLLRKQAVKRGLQDTIINLLEEKGFQILAFKELTEQEVEVATARTRGGNWGETPYTISSDGPVSIVIAYDHDPLKPNRRQRRRFRQRTNARLFVKEQIREILIKELPGIKNLNAMHSSDYAAEAWHMIEELAPELLDDIRTQLSEFHQASPVACQIPRAA